MPVQAAIATVINAISIKLNFVFIVSPLFLSWLLKTVIGKFVSGETSILYRTGMNYSPK